MTFDSSPRPIDQLFLEMARNTGTTATRQQALSVPAVRRGRNLLCSVATMPLEQHAPDNTVADSSLLRQIDPDVPNVVTLSQTVEDLVFEGIAWWLVTSTDFARFPMSARHLDVGAVSLQPPGDGKSPAPLPSGIDPRGSVVWVDGQPVAGSRVIRFDSPNPAVLQHAGREIRRAILLDKAASVYADDPRPSDYFTPADGADPVDDDEVDVILAKWKSARKRRATAYVPTALQYHTVDSPTPQQLQLVELQKQASLDIANALGIDPEDLGLSTTSRTYSNDVDRRRNKLNEVLAPYMRGITDRLSMGDVTRPGFTVRFNTTEYLMANPTERWAVYTAAKALEAITVEEIRQAERMPPLPADDGPGQSGATTATASRELQLVEQIQKIYLGVGTVITAAEAREILNRSGAGLDVDAPVAAPAPEPEQTPGAEQGDEPAEEEPVADPDQVEAARPAALTFNRDKFQFERGADRGLTFTDVPVTEFSVDLAGRTIEGLALPYGKIGAKYGQKFRFAKGALSWSEVGRVKLLREHGQAIGRAVKLTDSAAGLRVKFKVARGDAGDEALLLAEDGVLDGLSVGVDFDMAADTVPDPKARGVTLVRRADLREVSLTAMPAFDDARVTSVAASRTGDNTMQCTACGQVHAEGVACTAPTPTPPDDDQSGGLALSHDQLTALLTRPGALEAIINQPDPEPATPPGALTLSAEQLDVFIRSGTIGSLLGVPGLNRTEPEPDRPTPVDPTRSLAMSRVTEPAPYRFDRDGNLREGSHDFSSDLIAASRTGDAAAYDRALSWVQAEFDVATGDVNELNPDIQRPDMYVDQLEFTYPLWTSINKGTIANVTPFVVPKFNSSSGLVADHVQGVEPTEGTFTATAQTITPTPLSGKVEVSREAWDQGGNPQLSGLLWRQMTREWFEDLEASTATFLNTLTAATDINLGVDVNDEALDAAWTAAMSGLQFVRGGHRFNTFAVHIDLYQAFAAAVDTNGRHLFPLINPQNANGMAQPLFRTIDLAGVTGVPSWALGATSAGPVNSWLFNPEDVSGWASPPTRFDFQYRVSLVDVAIWGYKAFANTRIDGVRQVIYDTVV